MNTAHPIARCLRALAFLLAALAPAGAQVSPDGEASPADAPLRYARVASDGASIVNLPDDKGVEVLRAERGTLLSVWRELAGWLEVEVPGGFSAWMHGRYLQPTPDEGVFEVTNNAINVRPLPKSDVTSFPLPQRLHAGDRVRVVALADPAAPLADTWARIVTPPGVHAWIRGDRTAALAAGEDGAALWRERAAAAPQPQPARASAAPAGSAEGSAPPAGAAEGSGREELERLRGAIDEERAKESPSYAPLAAELRALQAGASAALQLEIQGELSRLKALEEVAQVRLELERERGRRAEELRAREAGVLEASRSKDPLGAVFRSRGLLLRSARGDEAPRFLLRFGNRDVGEVVCTSGRYDLDLFAGYEVGVFGDDLAAADGASVLDIGRLEVIKRR